MDKLAELVRDSEVRGAIAAFVDLGLVKIAGQEGFDALVDAVCQGIGDEAYDLQKVASLTEEILSEPENEEQEKTAGFGAVIGADRVSNLSDGEKAALIRHYGLSNDAALGLRNVGRGQLGGIAGNLLGSAAGMAVGKLAGRPLTGALIGAPIGGMLGIKLMTDKYSKANAQEIMKQRSKTASEVTTEKTPEAASETDDIAKKAALGELLQMKVAGQIDEKSFIEAASSLLEKDAAKNLPVQKVHDAEVVGGGSKVPWKRIAKGGAIAAGLAGGAALGKSLYDKYSGQSKQGK